MHSKPTITKRKCFLFGYTHTYLCPAVNLSKFVVTVEGDHVLGLPQPVRAERNECKSREKEEGRGRGRGGRRKGREKGEEEEREERVRRERRGREGRGKKEQQSTDHEIHSAGSNKEGALSRIPDNNSVCVCGCVCIPGI